MIGASYRFLFLAADAPDQFLFLESIQFSMEMVGAEYGKMEKSYAVNMVGAKYGTWTAKRSSLRFLV
ncbi:hypothetical protein Bca52824_026429 [Brassica carinata]|uniref:Uncharacterized protein n=1 Tax=Brassica carinata TaxID=52824 RepID=A0A8X7VAA4_BRACI|nr:hypothetical protein Bca52824_026429 [Brassica carinata]